MPGSAWTICVSIEVDEHFAMRPDALARQIEQDRRAGMIPVLFAPRLAQRRRMRSTRCLRLGASAAKTIYGSMWMPRCQGPPHSVLSSGIRTQGLELADSYTFNPHKWMFTNFDCNCFYVADRKALIQTLSILPEYLRNQATESGAVIDYRDWQIPLGRRFRALKLWFVIRHYGIEGLQHHVRRHVELAQQFAGWVRNDSRFELAAPVPLNLVCFRHKGGDDVNQKLMDRLNRSGDLYLTHTKLDNRTTLRFCVGQTNTERRHVKRAWKRIQEAADTVAIGK